MHWLHAYWSWTGGNVGAMPEETLIAGVVGFLFRDRIGRHLAVWWHKHHGEHERMDLLAMERRLAALASSHHEDMKRHVTEVASAPPAGKPDGR